MANTYYEKQRILASLALELGRRGWNVVGYKEDQSDTQYDHWDPASWSGYATKGDYLIAASGYLSDKPITRQDEKEGPCPMCSGTGTMQQDGQLYRLILGGGLSEPTREYEKGDTCKRCKGTGRTTLYDTVTVGHHPRFFGPGKGSSWSVCRARENGPYTLLREGRLFDAGKADRYGNSGKDWADAVAKLADTIEASASDRPAATAAASTCSTLAESAVGAIIRHNEKMNGVEVAFPAKPDPEVIAALKAAGFRWSMRSKVWYTRFSEAAIANAHRILGLNPAAAAVA